MKTPDRADWLPEDWEAHVKSLIVEIEQYRELLGELYQVCGSLLCDAEAFGTPEGDKLLTRISSAVEGGLKGEALLPWPVLRETTKDCNHIWCDIAAGGQYCRLCDERLDSE